MSDYQSLASAVETTLGADAWLGDRNNVRTIEVHARGFDISEQKDPLFIDPSDLPALVINPNAVKKNQEGTATNEILDIVTVQVATVTRHRDPRSGLTDHYAIIKNLEAVLDKQKSSANDLGIDAYVRQAGTTDPEIQKKGDYYFFTSFTEAVVELTTTF
ncbi:MAG: hypothetical protein GWN87_28145 [Desulfuromonadales bacterium]|nr:hypothetical protein [Desulfuromonadales bacterium]